MNIVVGRDFSIFDVVLVSFFSRLFVFVHGHKGRSCSSTRCKVFPYKLGNLFACFYITTRICFDQSGVLNMNYRSWQNTNLLQECLWLYLGHVHVSLTF